MIRLLAAILLTLVLVTPSQAGLFRKKRQNTSSQKISKIRYGVSKDKHAKEVEKLRTQQAKNKARHTRKAKPVKIRGKSSGANS